MASRPSSRSPALKVRVCVIGSIVTATVTVPALVVEIPFGGASATDSVTSAVAPATDTGAVSTWMSVVSCSASPSTVTVAGSTATPAIRKPGAGEPAITRVDRQRP